MSNPTVVFDPYAADHRDTVQAIVDNYCVASTGKAEWYPVAFFVKTDDGENSGWLAGYDLGQADVRQYPRSTGTISQHRLRY